MPYIRKMLMMLEPHTALFIAPMGVGKTHSTLNLLEQEYFNHFNFIVIICPTIRYNAMYHQQKWFNTDPYIIQIELGNHLYNYVKKIGNFILDR